ncbi:uncharacterized protein LOC142659147 [Rhinoderma darwinii]|uniref:uncharacterized protein LOC142659147 n=1 Tax=Rhinoderma darwinii TaxID=43563 RepID=UPI003F661AED
MSKDLKDKDRHTQERRGPVEDDETEDYGSVYNKAEEHDDSTENIYSIGSLHSYNSSFTSLQISGSIPPTVADFRWSPDVLSAFDKLPALNSDDVKTLNSFLGLSLTSRPVDIKNFLVDFQRNPDHYTLLRKLTQQLKSMGRGDIVNAMHKEKAALRWLGPALPEEHLIRDIVPSLWVPLTVKLSLSHREGYDWKWLAEQLSISRDFIDLWEQQGGVPADNVMKTWQVKVSEATVGRLFDLLIEHREDLAAML